MSFCRLVGCNHVTAPLSVREHVAFGKDDLGSGLDSLMALKGVSEAIIFSTCNRTEVYYCGGIAEERVIQWLSDFHHIDPEWLKACLYRYENSDTLKHLARVASGLDSIALGETQVLGQLKDAYQLAKMRGAVSDELDKVMQFIFGLAKKLRRSTRIGKEPISIASAAVNLANEAFEDFRYRIPLVVGAGQNARLITDYLVKRGIKQMYFANRTYRKAEELAEASGVKAKVVSLMDLEKVIPDADMIFTSTASPTILIGKGMIEKALRLHDHKRMFIADISVPRDLENSIAELSRVNLYTLDDLQRILAENMGKRKKEMVPAQKMIDKAVDDYLEEHSPHKEILESYRRRVDTCKEAELKRALNGTQDPDVRHTITLLADRLAAKLTHEPTKMIRSARRNKDYRQLHYLASGLLGNETSKK